MKKILLKLLPAIALVVALFLPHHVFAASFSTSLSGDDTFDTSTTLTVVVNNITGFEGTCGGFCGLSGVLTYDSSKIKITASSAGGFDVILGSNLVAYKTTGSSASSNIAILTITNIALADGESTVISLSEVIGSNGDDDIPGTGSTKTLTRRIPQQTQPQETTPDSQPEQIEQPEDTTNVDPDPDSDSDFGATASNSYQNSNSTNQEQAMVDSKVEEPTSKTESPKQEVSTTQHDDYNSTTQASDAQPSQNNAWIWIIVVITVIIIVAGLIVSLVLIKKHQKNQSNQFYDQNSESPK